ncbi:MAG: response regulator transcription factor [Proteobacteria bacterium]|nr:MAG: response regulator transcription factor [Pseudomonadota bacterium]
MVRNSLLIISDNDLRMQLLEIWLSDAFEVSFCDKLENAELEILSRKPDLLLLETSIQTTLTFSFCESLKTHPDLKDLPVIFLSGKESSNLPMKIRGLSLADDFMSLPMDGEELKLRVQAVAKRSIPKKPEEAKVNFKINFDNQSVIARCLDGHMREVQLTPAEFKILGALREHLGNIVTRETLTDAIGSRTLINSRTLDTHICSIRKKLAGTRMRLTSVFKKGYQLELLALKSEKAA